MHRTSSGAYNAPALQVYNEAHVENVTAGTHSIRVDNQPGCTVQAIDLNGSTVAWGPATVPVKISGTQKGFSIRIVVYCS